VIAVIGAQARNADGESRRCVSSPPDTGVHATQPRVQDILELPQREVGNVYLSDAGNHDESLARHVERDGFLDVAGENEHEPVAGTEAVVRIDRPVDGRIEWGVGGPKNLETENVVTAVEPGERVGNVAPHHDPSVGDAN
jgi:hypothetical protein